MAKLALSLVLIFACSIFASIPSGASASARKSWFASICGRNEAVTKLHFYVHNKPSSPDQTSYRVAHADITSESKSNFGLVVVFDDLMTTEPDINSEEVGRFQGFGAYADSDVYGLSMNVNFYFTSGKYRGSTLSMVGRNQVPSPERELAVVGGTGAFRFARGYAITTSHSNDIDNGSAIFEYTLYVTSVDDAAMYADN